jgi:hypothetical protein
MRYLYKYVCGIYMKPQGNFVKWLFHQRVRVDPIGDLARTAFADPNWDGGMKCLCQIVKSKKCDEVLAAYDKSLHEFRDQKKRYNYKPKAPRALDSEELER